MRVTRRFRALSAAGLVLALFGPIFEQPLLLVGAVGCGAVLVARQYVFLRQLQRLDDTIAVDLSVPQQYVREDETTPVTVRAGTADTPLSVTVTAPVPASASGPDAETRRVEITGTQAETTFEVTWPVVGTITFDAPTVTVTDRYGLFTESFQRGPEPQVTVEPRRVSSLHVGQGGKQALGAFGEHATGQVGEGLDPAELRQYVAGDSASDIDWKATARLNEPYVREHEVETDRQTVVVFDHRERFGAGSPGETKLDYLREIALAVAEQSRTFDDPLGLYTVGDRGLTAEREPSVDPGHYRSVQDRLYDLTATRTERERRQPVKGAGDARRSDVLLAGDGTAFGRTLRPFLQETTGYVRQIEGDPLFHTVETQVDRLGGTAWVVLCTDDRDRTALRETVKLARRGGGHVVVFLTPDVLFDPGGLSDLEAAYDRYAEFEEFRKGLAALDRVSVFEVGPGDRLAAVLNQKR